LPQLTFGLGILGNDAEEHVARISVGNKTDLGGDRVISGEAR
jgi:hypothetical protein